MAYQQKKVHDPIDNDVKLPAAIRAAAAKADGLHQQAYQTTIEDAPAHGQDGQSEVPKFDPAPAEAKKAEEKPAQPSADGENWEHKYASLKGRYDRQDSTISQLNSELAAMRAQIANLQNQPKPNADNTFKVTPKVTKEEREAYGEDFLDVSARAAREQLDPEIEQLKSTVAELNAKLGTVAAKTHHQETLSMNDYLDKHAPDWRTLNRDKNFLAWSNLRDPFSGVIRMDMLREAHQAGDAPRVAAFFNGFLSDEAAVAPVKSVQADVKIPLESLAAPGRAKTPAATTAPGEKETISRAQIAHFYALVNKGHYRGNEAEKDRLEKMIFEAEREGRIT